MNHVYFIAEAGVNHNGSLEMAVELVDVAAAARADAVKFQSFHSDLLVARSAPLAEYQRRGTVGKRTQHDMLKRLELTPSQHFTLRDHAKSKGIDFLSTPFDVPSLRLLTEQLGMDTIKVPSGEITNIPFLVDVARSAKHVILSTGASTLREVEVAVNALAFGFSQKTGVPTSTVLDQSPIDLPADIRSRLTLLHAVTSYPAPPEETSLLAIASLKNRFACRVGLSDHSQGTHISIAAVAVGATVLEKHFTLSRSLTGPDHSASLEPDELTKLITEVRDISSALGTGEKLPQPSEAGNRAVVRRSITAVRPILQGEVLTEDNIGVRRPGGGIEPREWWNVLGTKAQRHYQADEQIESFE